MFSFTAGGGALRVVKEKDITTGVEKVSAIEGLYASVGYNKGLEYSLVIGGVVGTKRQPDTIRVPDAERGELLRVFSFNQQGAGFDAVIRQTERGAPGRYVSVFFPQEGSSTPGHIRVQHGADVMIQQIHLKDIKDPGRVVIIRSADPDNTHIFLT